MPTEWTASAWPVLGDTSPCGLNIRQGYEEPRWSSGLYVVSLLILHYEKATNLQTQVTGDSQRWGLESETQVTPKAHKDWRVDLRRALKRLGT